MNVIASIGLGLALGFIWRKLVSLASRGVVFDLGLGVVGALVGGLMLTSVSTGGAAQTGGWAVFVSLIGQAVLGFIGAQLATLTVGRFFF